MSSPRTPDKGRSTCCSAFPTSISPSYTPSWTTLNLSGRCASSRRCAPICPSWPSLRFLAGRRRMWTMSSPATNRNCFCNCSPNVSRPQHQNKTSPRESEYVLKRREFLLRRNQLRQIRIGILPEVEELLIRLARMRLITLHRVGAGQSEQRLGINLVTLRKRGSPIQHGLLKGGDRIRPIVKIEMRQSPEVSART